MTESYHPESKPDYVDPKLNSPEHVDRVNRIVESIQAGGVMDFMRGWEDDMEDLKRLEDSIRGRIFEDEFVHVFLPFFAGDEVNTYNVGLGNWATVANNQNPAGYSVGAGYLSVDVIDRKTGQILFTVPPILQPNQYTAKGLHQEQLGAGHVMDEVRSHLDHMPAIGLKLFRDQLGAIVRQSLNEQASSIPYLEAWDAIFRRYGRDGIEGLEEIRHTEQYQELMQANQDLIPPVSQTLTKLTGPDTAQVESDTPKTIADEFTEDDFESL